MNDSEKIETFVLHEEIDLLELIYSVRLFKKTYENNL